ncbi:MAG: restriction endonuclease subunit S [Planctomycetota bacterium]
MSTADTNDQFIERPPRPSRWKTRSRDVIVGHASLAVGNPELPLAEGWQWTLLADVAGMESGHTPSRNHPEWWDGQIPWIGITDARQHNGGLIHETEQYTNQDGLDNSAARLLPTGTVCISRTASIGYVVQMGRPMATSQDFVNWVPTRAITSEWLRLVFGCGRATLAKFGKGSTHTTIYYPEWMSVHVALPPVVEQHAIAAKVEALFSELDAGVAQLEVAQALLKRYRQSVLKAAFEGRLTAEWREQRRREAEAAGEELPTAEDLLKQIEAERQERAEQQHAEWRRAVEAWEAAGGKDSGEKKPRRPARPKDPPPLTEAELESLPDLPEGWAWTRADMLVAADRPICYGILMPKDNVDDGVLYVKVRDMRGDRINVDALQRTAPEIAKQYERASLVEGDVLLAIRGTYGRVALVPPALEGGNITQDTARLTITRLVNRDFCAWALRAPECQNFFKRVARGVAVKGINIGDVRLCPMPLCSDEEQAEIVRKVESRLSVIDDIEHTTVTALAEAKALRQSILKRAFEGRLLDQAELEAVRSHSDYEPVERLLERIREQASAQKPTKKKATRKKRGSRRQAAEVGE